MSSSQKNPIAVDLIVSRDSQMMSDAAVFSGTRVFVKDLFVFFARGYTIEDFLDSAPHIKRETVEALLMRIAEQIEDGEINV